MWAACILLLGVAIFLIKTTKETRSLKGIGALLLLLFVAIIVLGFSLSSL